MLAGAASLCLVLLPERPSPTVFVQILHEFPDAWGADVRSSGRPAPDLSRVLHRTGSFRRFLNPVADRTACNPPENIPALHPPSEVMRLTSVFPSRAADAPLPGKLLHRAQQRGLGIQCFSVVRAEGSWDKEGAVLEQTPERSGPRWCSRALQRLPASRRRGRRRNPPRPESALCWKTPSVIPLSTVGGQKGIVLSGSKIVHRLEPVENTMVPKRSVRSAIRNSLRIGTA